MSLSDCNDSFAAPNLLIHNHRTCGAGNKKRTRKCPSIDGCGSEKTQDSINCELKKCPSRIGELFLRYKIK